MKRYEALAADIEASLRSGVLRPGDRLPSVRHTCASRGVSASTVFQAYYLLEARGLVQARERSGYFVRAGLRRAPPEPEQASQPADQSIAVDVSERVFEVLGERIRLGYTTEAWDGFLKAPDGRSVPGTFFRYGAVASIFVSNDGEDVFWLSNGKNGYSWNYVKEPLSLRTDIKEAMKVAQGKGAPHLVTIPIAGSSVMIPVKSGPVERHSGSVSVKGNAK